MQRQLFHPELFQNQQALVTGGGSGIGLRMAADLLTLGCRVIITGRDRDKLDQAAAELVKDGADGAKITTAAFDIRDEEAIEKACLEFKQAGLQVNLLINNAGGQFPAAAEHIKPKGFRAVVENNLTGTFLVSQAVFRHFMKENGGSIVNILMQNARGFPLMSHSAAARAGVENLTKTLAVEWAAHGIRINSVAPGIVQTGGLDTYPDEFKAFLKKAPAFNYAHRLARAEEISNPVLFLLSPGASYITGQTLFVDGAESLYNPLWPPVEHDRL